jgi:hypothetical protein
MKNEDIKKIMNELKTSVDFLAAQQQCYENIIDTVGLDSIALFFFSSGYMSCLDYLKQEKMSKPFQYKKD